MEDRIPFRSITANDTELIIQIDSIVRDYLSWDTEAAIVGFVGGMFCGDRPTKDKDIIVCLGEYWSGSTEHILGLIKELYERCFDSVSLAGNPYEGSWILAKYTKDGCDYEIQFRYVDSVWDQVENFPLSIQKRATVVVNGDVEELVDPMCEYLNNHGVILVGTKESNESWEKALNKYKQYYPDMKFYKEEN